MKVSEQQKALKNQLSQAVKAAMQFIPGAPGGTAEGDALLKEFSEVMDKIAAKLKESAPKGKLIDFNDFGVAELEHLRVIAPKVEEVKSPMQAQEKKQEEPKSEDAPAAKPIEVKAEKKNTEKSAEKNPEKVEEKSEKVLAEKAPSEIIKVRSDKQAEPCDEVVKKLVKEGMDVLAPKPVKVVSEKIQVQEVQPQEKAVVSPEKIAQPVEVKVSGKPEAKISEVPQKGEVKPQEPKVENKEGQVIADEVKETVILDAAAPETISTKSVNGSAEVQAQAKLGAILSAEIARIRADVSIGHASMEKEVAASSVTKAAVDVASKANNQGNSAAPRFNSFGGDFAKSSESASHAESARAARPLTPAASSRTMEKVENALKEAAKSRDGKTISLRLDPPELGSVKIDVSMRDGTLHARIVAESPAVNQLLRDKAHELQTTLRKLGLQVDTVSVSVSNQDDRSANNQQAFSQQKTEREFGFFGNVRSGSGMSGPHGRETVAAVEDHWIA